MERCLLGAGPAELTSGKEAGGKRILPGEQGGSGCGRSRFGKHGARRPNLTATRSFLTQCGDSSKSRNKHPAFCPRDMLPHVHGLGRAEARPSVMTSSEKI